jgi:hypothetical protein
MYTNMTYTLLNESFNIYTNMTAMSSFRGKGDVTLVA